MSTITLTPPVYSPSSDSPKYSREPYDGELRLDFVAKRGRTRPVASGSSHDGIHTKHGKGVTTILYCQDYSQDNLPCFSQRGVVSGEVHLQRENIYSVRVKLVGHQSVAFPPGGSVNRSMFSRSQTLWKKSTTSNEDTTTRSSVLPFTISFPSHFTDYSGVDRELPPSFSSTSEDWSSFRHAECSYSLIIEVTSIWKLTSWTSARSLTIPLSYRPSKCPVLGYPSSFDSTIKSSPGEWSQFTTKIISSDGSLSAIDCDFFIPSVRTFGIRDVIPFHMELRSTPSTLQSISYGQGQTKRPSSPSLKTTQLSVQLCILRQTNVQPEKGEKTWEDRVIGFSRLTSVCGEPEDGTLIFDGEMECDENVEQGGFNSGMIHVKDFIALDVSQITASQLGPLCQDTPSRSLTQFPIRLVAESFTE
ncbi:hypothetical protein C8Q75DRAFT_734974 [Abortiporus biennis]|nr:hypothetical protein C8Q75DRAFT_734974 [Abortiporus biennis]